MEHLSESALLEEIAMLREQESRVRQTLGRLEEERRRREQEFMKAKSNRMLLDVMIMDLEDRD
jgi:hypothetical protein